MQNAPGDGIEIQPDDPDHAYRSVVSDLVSRLGHVRVSLKLIESAVGSETAEGSFPASGEGCYGCARNGGDCRLSGNALLASRTAGWHQAVNSSFFDATRGFFPFLPLRN
jgi:hypothetical protein